MQISKRKIYLIIVLLAAFVTNINTLQNDYSFDDYLVCNNERVENGLQGLQKILFSTYDDDNTTKDYRPITQISFWIEYQILGKHNPHFSHFVQVILYLILLFFVFKFLKKNISDHIAFVATLIFALHPLHTEVVASLKNREEILAMLFGLFSLFAFIRYCISNKFGYALLGFVLYFIAILAKLSAFPFIIAIPAYYILYINDKAILEPKTWKKAFLTSAGLLLAFLLKLLIHYSLDIGMRVATFNENPLSVSGSILVRLKAIFFSIYYYAKLLFVPYPFRHYYGYNQVPILDPPFFGVLIGILIVVLICYFIFKLYQTKKDITFSLFWLVLFFLPFVNIVVYMGIISERVTFIPSLGFALLLSILTFQYFSKKTVYILLVATCLVSAVYSFQRNLDWKNKITLFSADHKALKKAIMPNYWYAKELRGVAAVEINKSKKDSILMLSKKTCQGILEKTEYFGAYVVLGNIEMYDYSRPGKALPYYEKALAIAPENYKATYEYALANMKLNNFDIAISFFDKTITAFPESYMSYYYLFQLYFAKGETSKALEYNKQILNYKPELDYYYLNMGAYQASIGNMDSAIKYYDTAVDKGCRDARLLELLIKHHQEKQNNERVDFLKTL